MLGPWSRQRSCYCWAHVSLPQVFKCIVARDLSLSRCRKAFLAGDLRKCLANCFSFRSTLYGAVLAEGAGRLHRSTGASCIPHGGAGWRSACQPPSSGCCPSIRVLRTAHWAPKVGRPVHPSVMGSYVTDPTVPGSPVVKILCGEDKKIVVFSSVFSSKLSSILIPLPYLTLK